MSGLRVACYGWVDRDAGSIASSNFLVIDALLRRGWEVDLYAISGHIPDPGYAADRFRYMGLPIQGSRWANRVIVRLPGLVRSLASRAHSALIVHRFRRAASKRAADEHADRPYELVLSLGVTPAFSIPRVPVAIWPQSAPQVELRALRRLRRAIVGVSGWPTYIALRGFYELRTLGRSPWVRRADLVLVANHRSRQDMIAAGALPERVHVVPYAVDLERFQPGSKRHAHQLVCVGRLDPRKRVDLLLEAFDLLQRRDAAVRLDIVGRPGYARGYVELAEQAAAANDRVRYSRAIPQPELVPLVASATALVQPSQDEEFGHAVAEAIACGTPVVLGPGNGTAEWLTPACCVRYDRDDAASLAAAMEQALSLAPSDVRSVAERQFSAAAVAELVEQAFEAAIGRS